MKKSTLIFSFAIFFCLFSKFSMGQASFIADHYSGCDNVTVHFTDMSVGATSWQWNFGNGNTSTDQNPNAQYNTVGTFLVTLTINGGSSFTDTIHVYQSPTASFTIDNDTTCIGHEFTFTSTSVPGTGTLATYEWSFGDGQQDVGTNSTIPHTYTLSGSFSVNLTVYDIYTCYAASPPQNIYVAPAPVSSFTTSPPFSCTVPVNVNFVNNNTSSNAYQWTFGDTASGSSDTSYLITPPSHTYSTSGSYTVMLLAITGNCIDTSTYIFNATSITASYSTQADTVCRYDTVFFTNTSSPAPGLVSWNFGDPASGIYNTSALIDDYHIFANSGWHTITMIADIGNGCNDTIVDSIYVLPQPVFSLFTTDDSTRCNVPVTIHFQSTGDNDINQWHWDFGDGGITDTSVLQNPNYTYNGFGTYDIQLIATNNFGCSDTITHFSYIQIQPPSVLITTPVDSGCANTDQFTFNATSTNVAGDTTTTYAWDFGDGTSINNGPTVTHTYTQCSVYDVSVTITTSGGCTATTTRQALIKTGFPPTADFTWQPSVMCYNDTTEFFDNSTANGCPITGWYWDFGSNEEDPIHVFPDTGIYDVTHVAYSNGCPDSITKQQIITIHPPKAIFTFYYNCANPYSVQFYDTSHGDELVVWNFGDGVTDATNAQAIVHTFTSTGQYQVMLHAYNFTYGCDDSTTSTINIYDPDANIVVANATGCYPFTANFDGSTSQDAQFYSWNFGDPASGPLNTSVSSTPVHTFNSPGFYTVSLTITDPHGCLDSTTFVVHAVGPIASFTSPDTTGCRPFATTFNSTSTPEGSAIVQYYWNFNYPGLTDLDTNTSGSSGFTYPNSGYYAVQLTVEDANGCRDSIVNDSLIFVSFPIPSFQADTFICDSISNQFTVNVGGALLPIEYEWDFGDGSAPVVNTGQGVSNTVSHTYFTNDIVFNIQVRVTDANGCDTTISQAIQVLRPSTEYVLLDSEICVKTLAKFYSANDDSIFAWLWEPDGPLGYTGQSDQDTAIFGFTVPGSYGLTVTVTNPGCTVTKHYDNILFLDGPLAFFTFPPTTHCPPVDITFTSHLVNGSAYEYIQWDFGDGQIGTTPSPDSVITHTYYAVGTYIPSAQIAYQLPNGSICTRADTNITGAQVVILNVLDVDITQDTILITEGMSDTLTSVLTPIINDPPYSYAWNIYPGMDPLSIYNITSAIYNSTEGDTAVILVVTDNSGCEARDTVYIEVNLCEEDMKIPNVFTPSADGVGGDGKNDTYYIDDLCPIEDFKITVFNRWGNIVYESGDYNFRWDGTDTNGKDCAEGVYYYTLHAKRKDLHGYIHVIRGKGSK
jgi:gliding motility-associated-like protein